ncbi:YCF48-related protein [Metapseudomonas resinovorans]|uniref:YCF48-related protein n=1 Tax=Metapseudomonas resinovorans TaxID=53412 RepID=UPI000401521E|nr:YCF48-related protein [Pseudomonas resinovorans]
MKRLDLQWLMVGAVVMGAAFAAPMSSAQTIESDPLLTAAMALLDRHSPPVAAPERAMLFAITRAGERLVAVGEHGIVTLSDDGGQTWRSASVPVDVNLTGVAFADVQNGWVIGQMGVVLHSSDGGESWQKQLDGASAAKLLLKQAQQQSATLDQAEREELLYRAEGLVADGPDKPFLDLLVEDRNTVTVVGAFNLALRSTDGGVSWEGYSQQLDNPNGMHVYALKKVDGKLMAAGEQGLLLRSDHAGGMLGAESSPYDGSYFGLLPMNHHHVLAYGLRGNAYVSGDAGSTWQRSEVPGSNSATFNAALQRSNGDVLLLDQSGRIHLSRDQGRDFRTLAFEWRAPLTGAVETSNGDVLLSSLAGVVQIPAATLAELASKE